MPEAVQIASAVGKMKTMLLPIVPYTGKNYDAVKKILAPKMSITRPPASFYLWPQSPIADDQFAQELFAQQNVTVLPGSFLSRTFHDVNDKIVFGWLWLRH